MLVIGIAGGTGSGKTSVAQAIVNKLGTDNVAFITQDSYYKSNDRLSMEERERINYDHPDSFDNELLVEHIHRLRNRLSVEVPIYDFSRHTRTEQTVRVDSKSVIIVEGILIFADEALRSTMDIKVFVDTDADVRVLRRLARDIKERGRTVESVFAQYLQTVKPMHDAFIEPSKRYADLIIPEGGRNEIGISLLTARIEQYIEDGRRGVAPVEIVKVATRDQLEQGLHVRFEVFVKEQGVSPQEELDEWDESPESCVHVLARDRLGHPIGAARFRAYDRETAKLQRIAVLKTYRSKGVGRLLVECMEREAAEQGFVYALLDAQVQAEGFYAKLGYTTISEETFLDAGIPHVRMRKRIR